MASVGVVVASASLTTQLPARALGSAPLRYVGTRSYALYLWHYPWLTWLCGDGTLGILLAF
jgi:peptidoglycan/LPS O-acetylase OafA/YrhL